MAEFVKIGKVEHYSIKSGTKTIGILTLSPKWELARTNGGFEIIPVPPEVKLEQEVQVVNEVQVVKTVNKETKREPKCTCGVIDDYYSNTFNCRKHGKGVRIDLRWPDPVDSDETKEEKPTVKREKPTTSTYETKHEAEPEAAIDYKAKVWTWLANDSGDE